MTTRRAVLLGTAALAAGALNGCGGAGRSARPAAGAGRLVTLDGAAASLAMLLGRRQVGTAAFLGRDPIVEAMEALQPGPIVDVSTTSGEFDLERLARLRPTLLVGFERSAAVIGKAKTLATLRQVRRTGRLDADVTALGAALSMGSEARGALGLLRSEQRRSASRLPDRRPPTVSVLSPGLDGRSLYTLGPATPAGEVVAALGLTRPEAQRDLATPGSAFPQIALERISDHDADLVFLLTGPTADPGFLSDEPLWRRLPAVRAHRVIEVDALRWATLSSLLDAWWVLDDLTAVLLEDQPPVRDAHTRPGLARIRRYRDRLREG